MNKILYVTTIDLTINTFLVPHIKHLINKGYKVDCACNINDNVNLELKDKNVVLHDVSFNRNPFSIDNIKAISQIRDIQRKHKYDIVHVHTPVASFITRFALRNEKIKVIYTCHGFHFYKGAPLINWLLYYPLEKISSRWTDKIITINNEDFNRVQKFNLRNNGYTYLMNGVGIDKEKYISNNFDKKEYRKQLGVGEKDLMILILAEVNKNKNHIQIIKALKYLKNRENIKVICAGRGPLEKALKEEVNKLNLQENIKFIGYRNDVKELLNSTDCVALFSKREGLGKCLLEGMLVGKILIATNTRGPKTIIRDKENGFLIDIGDYRKTSEVINNLANDNKLRESIVEKSSDNISKYLMNNVLEEIINYHK